MLTLRFFAQVREQLNCDTLDVAWDGLDLDALQAQLIATYGQEWANALGRDNLIRAVNQVVVDGNCELHDGDEVAFFPPVTGG